MLEGSVVFSAYGTTVASSGAPVAGDVPGSVVSSSVTLDAVGVVSSVGCDDTSGGCVLGSSEGAEVPGAVVDSPSSDLAVVRRDVVVCSSEGGDVDGTVLSTSLGSVGTAVELLSASVDSLDGTVVGS